MAILSILCYPDPRLHKVAKPVAQVDERIQTLVKDMLETMYDAQGIGLAATQIDVHERVIVIDVSEKRNEPMTLINPEILWASEEKQLGEEGCLSVPGLRGAVDRYQQIRYEGFDPKGEPIVRVASGFHARVVQHECDHLIGRLYPSRITDFSKFGFTEVMFPDLDPSADD